MCSGLGLPFGAFLLAYLLIKGKTYGERVSIYLALGMFFYSVGSALPIFYTHFRDIILIAVSFYRALAYLLFAYGVVKVEIVDVGKEMVIHSRAFLELSCKGCAQVGGWCAEGCTG
jgi:hypothetical protein